MRLKILKTVFDESSSLIIPGLPNDVGVVCLARVPLSYRLKVSSVCRCWRNLFHKDVFWDVRREHSNPEQLVVMWSMNIFKNGVWHGLYFSTKQWFKLPEMPDDNREKGYSISAVANGKLFVIGGRNRGTNEDGSCIASSTVSYFDFKSYRWEMTAPLNVARCACFTAGVINDQLYVFGGLTNRRGQETFTVEVYNPNFRTWRLTPGVIPFHLRSGVAMKGKFYAVSVWGLKGAVYDPQGEEWTEIPEKLNLGWCSGPVQFEGRICGRICIQKHPDEEERVPSISAYNLSENTWELIHGQNISEGGFCWHRLTGSDDDRSQLVVLGGRLHTIRKSFGECDFELFEIIDLTNNDCIAWRPTWRMCNSDIDCENEDRIGELIDYDVNCGVVTL